MEKRYSEEQIIWLLKEADTGVPIIDHRLYGSIHSSSPFLLSRKIQASPKPAPLDEV